MIHARHVRDPTAWATQKMLAVRSGISKHVKWGLRGGGETHSKVDQKVE
jgi:hypothetical protein